MHLRLDDPTLVANLQHHFERSGFAVQRLADNAISVRRPDAPSPEQARREVAMHAAVWSAVNPDAKLELLDN
jgi:hypothetical protein